jgi:hypothetical protein
MHWGRGNVIEEAYFYGEYHEPAIQLLEFEDGTHTIRFCFYRGGGFSKNPLMLGENELAQMRRSLAMAPRLRKLLKRMVG